MMVLVMVSVETLHADDDEHDNAPIRGEMGALFVMCMRATRQRASLTPFGLAATRSTIARRSASA